MTREEKLAYQRGYEAGRSGRWPAHKLPAPPEPVVRRLIEAVAAIRMTADDLQAVFGPDDEVVLTFDKLIDEADAAVTAVEAWLLDAPAASRGVSPP